MLLSAAHQAKLITSRYVLLFALCIIIIAVLIGCSDTCELKETHRVFSPDKRVYAVMSKLGCGATVGYSNRVHIVPAQEKLKKDRYVFMADKVKNIKLRWVENKKLLISYDTARIFEFTNFWTSPLIDDYDYIVWIQEQLSTK